MGVAKQMNGQKPSFGCSHIDQPKDKGEMSFAERDALFDATLERDDVADSAWEAVKDELTPAQHREFVRTLFRQGGGLSDFYESARIIHRYCARRVEKIVDDESSNTVME